MASNRFSRFNKTLKSLLLTSRYQRDPRATFPRNYSTARGAARAAIFRAHEEFLDDPDLVDTALERIKGGHSAGWWWRETFEERARDVANLGDALLRERAVDLQDVGRRVLRLLADTLEEEPGVLDSPVILVAEDLSPSDTAKLDPAMVLGLCTAAGGPTSHTAIIARSRDIPAIVGAGPAILNQPEGGLCVLDGDSGNLYCEPSEADLSLARAGQEDWHRPNLPYSFKILDSPVVNAFAVPGGYVYFTRGIMCHFNNEAEFAGVLGHEIGQITAKHSARQQRDQILGQIAIMGGIIFSEKFREFADVAQQGVGLLFLKNSRDHETESDKLGVEYSTKIGYDANQMAGFFKTLKKLGGSDRAIPTFLSTHPDPGDRFNNVGKLAVEAQKGLDPATLKRALG